MKRAPTATALQAVAYPSPLAGYGIHTFESFPLARERGF